MALEKSSDRRDGIHSGMAIELPGPTGESNQYSLKPRGRVLCLGPPAEQAEQQVAQAQALGCTALAVAPGVKDGLDGCISTDVLKQIDGLEAVIAWSEDAAEIRKALAELECIGVGLGSTTK